MFLESLNFGKIKPISIVYGLSCAALIVLQCVTPIWFADDLLMVWHVYGMAFLIYVVSYDVVYAFLKCVWNRCADATADAGTADTRRADSGTVGTAGIDGTSGATDSPDTSGRAGSGIFWRVFFRSLQDTELGNIFILMTAVIFTGIYDIIDSVFLHTGLLVTRFSFFAFMLCMAFLLARKYADRFLETSQTNDLLEVTVRRRTRQLEEQVLIAEAASRAKGSFLANMSHEIRTPLNAVIGMTTIGAQSKEPARKDYAFAKIKEASGHLLGTINDILDMSKIEAGRLDLSIVDLRVREVVARVGNVMRFRADEKRQDFIVSVAADVPDALRGDDLRLAQVLTNLVGNAVKFTPDAGKIALDVSFDGEAEKGVCTLRFLVRDTGIGISAEQKPRLFNAFQQAEDSTTRQYGGTGLGLALSKQIVELMGGRIWVDSEPGQGSTFGFTAKLARAEAASADAGAAPTGAAPTDAGVPAAPSALAAHDVSPTPSALTAHDVSPAPGAGAVSAVEAPAPDEIVDGEFAGRVILLADDVEINREILIALIETSDAVVECAENGAQAVEMFERSPERYDLILMDLQMPVMDGYEAARRIREAHLPRARTIPIVAMTANVFREDIERTMACGMNAHLGKPVELPKLLAMLRRYVGRPARE
jgi:signal transduction histidine kinase/CheY-like chemotaxis protein